MAPHPSIGKSTTWLVKSVLAGVVALLVILLTQVNFLQLGALQRLELATIDYRFEARGMSRVVPDSAHVVIVEISEDSFKSLPEKFPWPRSYYAHLIRNLHAAGARAVGIDLILSGPDPVPRNDSLFRAALRETKIAVLAGKREEDNTLYTSASMREDFGNIFFADDSSLGLVNIRTDADGIYRFYNPYYLVNTPGGGETPVPTFAFAILDRYFSYAPFTTPANRGGSFAYAGRNIPKYDPASFLINYYGPNGTFRHVKFDDVIDDETFTTVDEATSGEQINTFSDPDFGYLHDGTFKDKIVLVGVTVPEYKDLFPVPLGQGLQKGDNLMYGVEIHANVVESVLRNEFLRLQPPVWTIIEVVLLAALTFFVTTSTRAARLKRQALVEAWRFVFVAAELLLFSYGVLYLFTHHNFVASFVPPVLAIGGSYVASIAYSLMAERKQRMVIKNMFSTYVNPTVVDALVANPDKLVLGGERKELTVLFSDIEGFTTISQHMPPELLVTLLNEYLSVMSGIIFKNDGTVDKYEGDAVMAFWGAPLPQSDHALRACVSALQMQEALKDLNRTWQAMQRPFLKVRIGINTGDMVVGNMGATGKFAYTVMGDSVNLASRLEGANKEYQTRIMVSRRTYELVEHKILGRELDRITVKGRTEPVTTYELVAMRDHPLPAGMEQFLALYAEGMEFSRRRSWTDARRKFEEALQIMPDDYPSRVHFLRMQKYEAAPPDDAGEDIVKMEHK
jgi:adenylate cyclase